MTEYSVEHTRREVIEGKLLAALDDEGKVAIIASEEDCEFLIRGLVLLEHARMDDNVSNEVSKIQDLLTGLRQLKEAAF